MTTIQHFIYTGSNAVPDEPMNIREKKLLIL